jgi:Mrp family chromosome partitioning ATPase
MLAVRRALVACGLVFFFEYLDSRIKTPDEIRIHLRLPAWDCCRPRRQSARRAYPLSATAFRELRRSVSGRPDERVVLVSARRDRSIVVTSTGPGEGKSMVASNLAISLAQADQRTAADRRGLRRPKAHEIFELSQEPGLSNLSSGTQATKRFASQVWPACG